ncbi:MAG: TatD family hydrolase, partial [Tepidiformaceae bacterium]
MRTILRNSWQHVPVTGPAAVRWFDAHVHLERYGANEAAAMLARGDAAGVRAVLAVSTSVNSSERTVRLPAAVFRAVGLHPTRANEAKGDDWLARLRQLAGMPGVVAIGEAGCDTAGPGWPVQRACFIAQAGLARGLELALILHIDGEG